MFGKEGASEMFYPKSELIRLDLFYYARVLVESLLKGLLLIILDIRFSYLGNELEASVDN